MFYSSLSLLTMLELMNIYVCFKLKLTYFHTKWIYFILTYFRDEGFTVPMPFTFFFQLSSSIARGMAMSHSGQSTTLDQSKIAKQLFIRVPRHFILTTLWPANELYQFWWSPDFFSSSTNKRFTKNISKSFEWFPIKGFDPGESRWGAMDWGDQEKEKRGHRETEIWWHAVVVYKIVKGDEWRRSDEGITWVYNSITKVWFKVTWSSLTCKVYQEGKFSTSSKSHKL